MILGFIATTAHADLPLTVADILADENRFKLDTDVSYHNHHKSSSTTQGFEMVDLGNGRTVYLPSIGENHTNSDSLIAGLGLHYGVSDVSDKLEVSMRTNGVYRNARHQNGSELSSTSDAYLQNVSLGTQYQLAKNHAKLPDMLTFGELSLYDNIKGLKRRMPAQPLSDLLPIRSMTQLC